jgi:hypothetical protein
LATTSPVPTSNSPIRGASTSDEATDVVPAPLPAAAKPIRVVRSAEVGIKTYLESVSDVDDYIEKLRAELLSAITSGHRVRVQ